MGGGFFFDIYFFCLYRAALGFKFAVILSKKTCFIYRMLHLSALCCSLSLSRGFRGVGFTQISMF